MPRNSILSKKTNKIALEEMGAAEILKTHQLIENYFSKLE